MIEPKRMTERRFATSFTRCPICGRNVLPGEMYHTMKPKRGRLQYMHAGCWEKELKK